MIKIENITTYNWPVAMRGMRNPLNSWEKSDSGSCLEYEPYECSECPFREYSGDYPCEHFTVGYKDLELATKLVHAGTDHSKFMRMIGVSMDITAPLYWWAEFDTYKVGTVRNSCSKMHTLMNRKFEMSDFSFDRLPEIDYGVAAMLIGCLNEARTNYINCKDGKHRKELWYGIIQLLPESYNQRSTVQLNYQVLRNIYFARRDHKLDEWHEFCRMIEHLPYADYLLTDKKGV